MITQVLTFIVLGYVSVQWWRDGLSASAPRQYPFLAQRIQVENPNDVLINFENLRTELNTYVDRLPARTGIDFEYLPTGISIGVNSTDEFFRASLVKLPVVMRTYKYIEAGQLSLRDTLTIEEKQIDQSFGNLWKRGVGGKVTVEELIKLILDESDNTAFNVLYEKVNVQLRGDAPTGDQSPSDVYDYLDIPHSADGITPMITPKNYSSILKSLFFSNYLSYQDSNDILRIMSLPHPEQWLRQPIPSTIPVANKIGQYEPLPTDHQVFADCGIVFVPSRTYSLCMMVNTPDEAVAVPAIRDVSRLVYSYVTSQPR